MKQDYDYIVIGSGFGGSVSALRLSEKGYRVLVIEKGKRWKPEDFPRTNWNLRKWLWLPLFRFHGFFKMTFMRHVGILSGVGVGGGSLVYANTLPRPEQAFFKSGSWAGLADWEAELEPHYREAERMLGATQNPELFEADLVLKEVASGYKQGDRFEPTRVAVFFGEPEKKVEDPYFDGNGPVRSGCNHCGACMTGCRHNAKNTLDKNYLYLAEQLGAEVMDGTKVIRIEPEGNHSGEQGYRILVRDSLKFIKRKRFITSQGLILSGGALGTVRLLLNMKRKHLKELSGQLGDQIRTNNESLVLVHSRQKEKDFSKGVAIGSIFPPDQDTHLEAVRYGSGSGFWKMMAVPLTHGKSVAGRIFKLTWRLITRPASWLRIYVSRNFAEDSMILLFMQHLDSTLRFKRGLVNLRSTISQGEPPSAFMPLARELAEATSRVIDGTPFVMATEALTGTPTTAHILGGCVIGKDIKTGVINKEHKVFGYSNMYVCDGSAISANPGVNPALTITAMTERAMAGIPEKK
ncbi:MAG: GMC family oxidoreductase [Bacteroidota bacterium]